MPPIDENELGPRIERAGYKYVEGSGFGAGAMWVQGEWSQDKRGKWNFKPLEYDGGGVVAPESQEQIANQLYPSSSPYIRANQQQAEKPDRITQGGIVYERGGDGEFRPLVPREASGDGGMTAYQGAQLAQQDRQWQATFDQNMVAAQRQYEQKQAELQQQKAINDQNMAFARDKEAFAQSQDNKRLAMQAQTQMQSAMVAQADIQFKQATLDMQWQTFNATAMNEAAKFNQQMAFNVQQANQQFESQKQDRLANMATQAGTLAQDPGDRGKFAATVLANSGWGGGAAVTSGQDYRTEDSLVPLESLLRTREDVQKSSSPYTFTPAQPSLMSAPTMPQVPSLAAMMGGAAGGAAGGAGAPTPQTVQDSTPGYTMLPGGGINLSASEIAAGAQYQNAPQQGIPAAKHGGMVEGAYIGDEEGPELHIPMGDKQTIILNNDQAKSILGVSIKDLMARGQERYADGGIFDGGFQNVQDTDRTRATGFLSDAYKRAVSGTPFAGMKTLPSAVYLSSPGTNPFVAQLLGSLKALGEGTPAAMTSYYADLYRPTGMREMITGRSR